MRSGDSPDAAQGGMAARYRRKGWSKARIERAMADSQSARTRPLRQRPNEDAAYWIALLRAAAARLTVKRLGLMRHACRTAPGGEHVAARRIHGGALAVAANALAAMDDAITCDFDVAASPARSSADG